MKKVSARGGGGQRGWQRKMAGVYSKSYIQYVQ